MKFFMPLTDSDEDAEWIRETVRGELADLGMPTTDRRIWALLLHPECRHLVEVGLNTPASDEPVMLILEASNVDVFYVCTPSRGVLEGVPYPLGLTERGRAIDFDESPGMIC